MKTSFDDIAIKAITSAVPADYIENEKLDVENIEKIINTIGVKKRHYIKNKRITPADMALEVGRDAMKIADIGVDKVRALIYVTLEPEDYAPSTAFLVQRELGLTKDCVVYDIHMGCNGYVAGLQTAASLLHANSEIGSAALLIYASQQVFQKRSNENDSLLFGDGAGATLLVKEKGSKPLIVDFFSDGSRYASLLVHNRDDVAYMDAEGVFRFSIFEVSKSVVDFMRDNNIDNDSIDYFVPHQAQYFIIKHMAKTCRINKEKMLMSLDCYGNTSGASIPVTLCHNRDKLNIHNKILTTGYGIGLAWGVAYFEVDGDAVGEVLVV